MTSEEKTTTLGGFLASRFAEIGVTHVFGVPGDFNLVLLDQLLANKRLNMIWTCNELNAGYAADGYCRHEGVGACVVTYGVGGLSLINAAAGCYSEDLPVIFISGGPNSNDYAANHTLHHTIGLTDFGQQYRAFKEVTCAQVIIQHLTEAHHQIDHAISRALVCQKPAYIEICCNLAGLSHSSFRDPPIPFAIPAPHTNPMSQQEAVAAAVAAFKSATKPVLLGGPRLRVRGRRAAFRKLADAAGCAVATTADAKGMFPEDHPGYIGTYWGSISSPTACEVVEASDCVLVAGAVWTDYSTLGYSHLLPQTKTIEVRGDRVIIKGGASFGCLDMEDFLNALSETIPSNPFSLESYHRMVEPLRSPEPGDPEAPLTRRALYHTVEKLLSPDSALLAETGDSWFNALGMRLPPGCGFELQMRYGSIGWSVGATLGYSLAAQQQGKRLISLIGDGSFQVTAQDVSSMLRFGANPIIILSNNAGYTIEIEIHDGPYNRLQNWDYVGLVKALHNGQGKLVARRVKTPLELQEAVEAATAEGNKDALVVIEAVIDTHDCTKELLEFGARVAAANSRPPNPQ